MEKKTTRLYFIDAMRAWAILMMLQGHFIDGLLDNAFRDNSDFVYSTWKYFRGMTAPVFFTVSGFIFTYLLIRVPEKGFENPRVKKGIRRGLELLAIGYLLRMNLMGILNGEIYSSTYLVDVLHCIGLSILGIIGIYLLTYSKKKFLFPTVLVAITMLLFLFEPQYQKWTYGFLPDALANYFTKTNGSVFTIFPWFGYASFGAFISVLFTRYKNFKHLYPAAISIAAVLGVVLIFFSSDFFLAVSRATGLQMFADIFFNNYLFIRLGDVFIAFAVFMMGRQWLTNSTLLKIGQSTLSIYIIHFIILYGSFTGLGLYQYFHHSLSPTVVIASAIAFMVVCSFTALVYEKHKASIKTNISIAFKYLLVNGEVFLKFLFGKAKVLLLKLFGLVKN
ncbi:acyltransferase family protein [Maribacter sp. 2308TA10-17]|uniref:acyltransferase family protein n=1 Tax=Maribacter sp. 2308TA10-17 TaxID=3386276 RepID=UPI0039BC48A8